VSTLPNDIARCAGVGSEDDPWRERCETCLRRASTGGDETPWIEPPPIIEGECEYFIDPEEETP
jgi:hypothetical protein